MGFFGSIFREVKNLVRDVASAVGDAANWVYDKCVGKSKEVGESEALNENSNIMTVEKMNNLLHSYSEDCKKDAQKIENKALYEVNDYFINLINLLKKNSEIESKIGLATLMRKQQDITAKIPNSITNVMARKISLDNNECREILALPPSDSKRYKMQNYCDRVLREATDNLAYTVSGALNEQGDMVNTFLEEFIEEKERSLDNMHYTILNLEKEKEQGDFNAERMQLLPRLKIELIDKMSNKLGA